jgi:glucokinase
MPARGGIDLGGTKIQTVVIDGRNNVLGEARRPTPTHGGPPAVAEAMAEVLREAADQAGWETDSLTGVGVGSPGEINVRAGTVTQAKNLPDWGGTYELGPALSDALGTRVKLGNDVQVATDAEFALGVGKEYSTLLGVFWGTGVGGGLILDGKPWLGRGSAMEIGHVVVERGGAKCPCGRRGCMEAYAGRYAMEREAHRRVKKGAKTDLFKIMEKRGRTRLTSGVFERALKADDAMANELIDRAVKALGTAIASACNLIDPEAIVLGGGLGVRLGDRYLEAIQAEMMVHLFNDDDPPVMKVAELGDLGGAIGASLLVKRTRRPTARRTAKAA